MIYLRDNKSGLYNYGLRMAYRKNKRKRSNAAGFRQDITQQVVDTGQTVFVPDMSVDSRFEGIGITWKAAHT